MQYKSRRLNKIAHFHSAIKMYAGSKLYCIFISFTFLIIAQGRTVNNNDLVMKFNSFPCELPQARAFTVREITKQDHLVRKYKGIFLFINILM